MCDIVNNIAKYSSDGKFLYDISELSIETGIICKHYKINCSFLFPLYNGYKSIIFMSHDIDVKPTYESNESYLSYMNLDGKLTINFSTQQLIEHDDVEPYEYYDLQYIKKLFPNKKTN